FAQVDRGRQAREARADDHDVRRLIALQGGEQRTRRDCCGPKRRRPGDGSKDSHERMVLPEMIGRLISPRSVPAQDPRTCRSYPSIAENARILSSDPYRSELAQ